MKHLFRGLTSALMITGAMGSLVMLATPRPAHAATTCTPQPTLPANVSDPNAAFDTGANRQDLEGLLLRMQQALRPQLQEPHCGGASNPSKRRKLP
jgi:hypothetical protein